MNDGTPKPASEPQPRAILWFGIYAGAWALALLSVSRNVSNLLVAWLFPLGVLGVFGLPSREGTSSPIGLFLACAWFVYLVHGVCYFRAKRVSSRMLCLCILAFLLSFNAAGCRRQISESIEAGFIQFR